MTVRKRILFLAEGATMAHFVRPLALAEALEPNRYEIHFYAPSRYSGYLKDRPFIAGDLASMPGEQFLDNLAKGQPLFSAATIRDYVTQDRELIRNIRPDLVIGDMRLSLPISARKEGTPYAVLFNAYWSPFAKRRWVVPSLPITRILPPRYFGAMYRAADPLVNALHAREMNKVRREFGIPDLPPDLRAMYTDGDYVLYPDIPEFVPTPGRPGTHQYVGICPWSPPTAKPDWWDRMRSDPKPKVFVSLGSSGPLEALPALLRALSRLPVAVILASSGRQVPVESGAYTAALLPFTETAKEASVVVSHGGSGGLYPAIAAGTPVLGIPSNADQHMSTAVLEENGPGLGIRVEEASEKRLFQCLEKLLLEPQYRRSAQEWAAVYARYDSGEMFRRFVAEVAPD
ncbi:MAG: nucleotide disphospho-sugar-binding domain-containing protein [Candidatus Solibacter sp.]